MNYIWDAQIKIIIVIGTDVAGNIYDGQSRYIAIIIGTEESINNTYNKIEITKIHMASLSKKKKQHVIQNLKFKNNDLLALCLHVKRQKIIDYIYNNDKLQPKYKPKFKIQQHFDYLLLRKIRSKIEFFANARNQEIKDITMQCDSDMNKTGGNWGMKVAAKGKAYEMADAIAWCNERKKQIDFCLDMDLAQMLKEEMENDLLK